MFTGIIEGFGEVKKLIHENENLHITMESPLTPELKIDQSVAHNGVCLTVVEITEDTYVVTAIKETLDKTNLGTLSENDLVNIERAMKLGDRLDGHIVQGHVDQTAKVVSIEEVGGSWNFRLEFDQPENALVVSKGSVSINGVSLTVVEASQQYCSVSIIPFTYEHTTFMYLKEGDKVNIEFDILGKYVLEAQRRLQG